MIKYSYNSYTIYVTTKPAAQTLREECEEEEGEKSLKPFTPLISTACKKHGGEIH